MSIPPSYNNPPNPSTAAGYAQQQQQFAANFPLQHQQQPNPGFGQQPMQQQFHPTMGMHPQQMVGQFGGMQMSQQPIQQMGSSSGGNLQVNIQPSQLAPSTSSAGGPPSHSGPAKPAQLPLEKRITPPGLPPQMLTSSEQMSVEMLCTLGRELVLELMTRMFSIVNTLKLNIKGDNKPNKQSLHGVDNVDTIRFQLEYSRLVFLALTEIRLRIDLKLSERLADGQTLKDANPTDAELLQILADPSPLEEQNEEEAKKAALVEQFEQNRQQLVRLNCQMKKLEWLATCSDPATLNSGSGGGRSGGGGRRSYESTTSRRS